MVLTFVMGMGWDAEQGECACRYDCTFLEFSNKFSKTVKPFTRAPSCLSRDWTNSQTIITKRDRFVLHPSYFDDDDDDE